MTALTILLSVLSMLLGLVVIALLRKSNPFHPIIFLLLFAAIDVLFPAVYWSFADQIGNPEWLTPVTDAMVLAALCFYIPFLALLTTSFLAICGPSSPRMNPPETAPSEPRLKLAASFLLVLTLAKISAEVAAAGGIEPWIWSRVVFGAIVDGDSAATATRGGVLSALPLREAFQAVAGLCFFYRKRLSSPRLFGIVFPAAALLLAAATFLRGTVLTCAITLIFAEVMRRRREEASQVRWTRRQLRLAFMSLVAVVLSIYVYGSLRDSLRGSAASGVEDAASEFAVPTFLSAGHGLLGISHIVSDYGHSVPFLWGKTYLDMLLLPVPRSVYPSKPDWYGIDDITRGMGWPETTQSAVTMPGEAFANFGYLGLLMALPMGALLGQLQRLSAASEIRYLLLGPTIFFQIASVANWMSFTGIMNAAPSVVLLLLVASWIGRGTRRHRGVNRRTAWNAARNPSSPI